MSDIPNDSSSAEEFYQHVKLPAENVVERRTGPVPEDVPAAEYLPSGPALFEEVDEIFFNYEDQINYDVREGGAAISNLAVSPLLSDFPQPQSVYSRTEENEQTNNDVTGTGRDLEEDAVPSKSSPQEMKAVAPMKVFAERGTVKDSDDESLTDEYSDHQPQSVFSGTVEPDNENTDVTDSLTTSEDPIFTTPRDLEENASVNSSQEQVLTQDLPVVTSCTSMSPSTGSNVSAYKAPDSWNSGGQEIALFRDRQSCEIVSGELAQGDVPIYQQFPHQPEISEKKRIKNRLYQQKSRAKKKAEVERLKEELEEKKCTIHQLQREIEEKNCTIQQLNDELNKLKFPDESHDNKYGGE